MRTVSALALALLAVPQSPAAAGDAGEKKICREAQAPLGSRIKRPRICHTQAEWAALEEARRALPVPVKVPQAEPWERTRAQ